MPESRTARRYALAALSVAEEIDAVDAVSKDFEFIESMIRKIHDFRVFLLSPVINTEKKKTVLTSLLSKRVSDLTFRFVLFLASKGRENLLEDIFTEFYRLRDDRRGILHAETRTASPFTDAQEKELLSYLQKITKKKVRLSFVSDPSLKGGFTVRYGDTVLDASVRHQLQVLERKFSEAS